MVEAEGIGIDVVAATPLAAGRKSMPANAVFVIALSIESPVDADADADTRNAEASAVDMHSIYQIRLSL